MVAQIKSDDDLRVAGIDALAEALGVVGAARFLLQFNRPGRDFTAERSSQPDAELDALLAQVREWEAQHPAASDSTALSESVATQTAP